MRTIASLAGLIALSCGHGAGDRPTPATETPVSITLPSPVEFARAHPEFAGYWHQGLAELDRFRLRQARYGETHDGEAVLIFVTEPFLPDLQVKLEHGEHPEAIDVLKTNAYRRFYTGIYPYTVLTSTFLPERDGPALKVSGTVQEWCGHAYTQINRRNGGLEVDSHSYFQDEADRRETLPEARLEDALFAELRRDPSALPTGSFEMVPAVHYLRMRHQPLRAQRAEGHRSRVADPRFEGETERYEVRYPELGRTLTIFFRAAFPFEVLGWEEDGEEGHTEAIRTHAVMTDYWMHHGAGDEAYRTALGLEY